MDCVNVSAILALKHGATAAMFCKDSQLIELCKASTLCRVENQLAQEEAVPSDAAARGSTWPEYEARALYNTMLDLRSSPLADLLHQKVSPELGLSDAINDALVVLKICEALNR